MEEMIRKMLCYWRALRNRESLRACDLTKEEYETVTVKGCTIKS